MPILFALVGRQKIFKEQLHDRVKPYSRLEDGHRF